MDGTGTDCPLGMRLPNLRIRELDCCSLTVMGKPAVSNGTVSNAGALMNPNVVIGNGGSSIKDSGVSINDVVTSPAPDGPLTANKLVFGDPALGNTVESSTIGVTGGNSLTNVNNIAVTTINGGPPGGVSSVAGDGTFVSTATVANAVTVSLSGPSAKGSLIVGNGTKPVILPVGANLTVLQANSAAPNGVNWVSPSSIVAGDIGSGTNTHVARWDLTGKKLQDSGVTLAGPGAADFGGVDSINSIVTVAPTVSSTSFIGGGDNVAINTLNNGFANGMLWCLPNSGTTQIDGSASGMIATQIFAGGGTFNITGTECLVLGCGLGTGTMGTAQNIMVAVNSTATTMNCSSGAIIASDMTPSILGGSTNCAIIGGTQANQIGIDPATPGHEQIILASEYVQALQDLAVCGGGFTAGAVGTANRRWELRAKNAGAEGGGNVGATGDGALVLKDTTYVGKTFGDIAELYENSVSGIIPDGTILTRDPLARQKCKVAAPGDQILGVCTATATVVSGVAEFAWHKMYKTTKFGRHVYAKDENGESVPVLNEQYDAALPYVSRLQRPQDYTICGYSGRVLVRAGDYDWSTAPFAQPGPDGKAQPSTTPTRLKVETLHSAYDATDGFAVVLCLLR